MTDEVMAPVLAILLGAILIATGLLMSSYLVLWIRILFGLGGVAAIILGMAMLFGLAYGKPKKT